LARTLRPRTLLLLAAAVAMTSVLASWSLSRRMEQATVLIARSDDLAEAVHVAAAALQDSVARARLAAQAVHLGCCAQSAAGEYSADAADAAATPSATGSEIAASGAGAAGLELSGADHTGKVGRSGRAGDLADYWRAEAEATRQLDSLRGLSLEPGLEWLTRRLVSVRDASLMQMAATDDALRRPAPWTGAVTPSRSQAWVRTQNVTAKSLGDVPGPGRNAEASPASVALPVEDRMNVLAVQMHGETDDHRRNIVAPLLAQAALNRRHLVAAVLVGAVLSPALMLAAWRGGRILPAQPAEDLVPVSGPGSSRSDVAEHPGPGVIPGAAPIPHPVVTMPALRVLLVEDNAMVRFSLEMMLSDLGHTVSAAADAGEATRLAETAPDVLVTDLGLPDLDGLTLATRLRTRHPRLRVVIASGHPGSAPDMVWLQKPFGLDLLRRAVEASEAPRA